MICLRDARGTYTIEGEGMDTRVVYTFPRNMTVLLSMRNRWLALRKQLERVGSFLFYMFRISFGVFLLGTVLLLLCVVSIIVIGVLAAVR